MKTERKNQYQKSMETKSKRISLSRIDKYVADRKCFGWELASQDDLKPDNTVLLTLQREPKNVDDYKTVKKLEKQYNKLNRSFPLLPIILACVGGVFLLLYFFLKGQVFFNLAFIYIALTSFFVALFALVVFLLLLIKRNKLLVAIKQEASNKVGSNSDWPTQRNVLEEGEFTWALIQSVKE